MRNKSDSIDDECWSIIWRAPVQQRISAFLWIVCHDRVMGNSNRYKRYLVDDPKCVICNDPEETTLHILRDCPSARSVLRKVGGPANSIHFTHGSIKQWVKENLSYEEMEGRPVWATYFGITLWWIWRWRNCVVFSRQQELSVDIGAFLKIRYEENRRDIH